MTIISNIKIGRNVFIEGDSLVIMDIPDHVRAVGVLAGAVKK